jgi:hypothetical protein
VSQESRRLDGLTDPTPDGESVARQRRTRSSRELLEREPFWLILDEARPPEEGGER